MAGDEKWLAVPGYPGYEVSDHGRVRSLERTTTGRWGEARMIKGRVLSQVLAGGYEGKRYRACTLYRDKKPKQIPVHVLALETFVGPRPEKGMHGCHRDDDVHNNRLDNLYWGTPAQNGRDAVLNGLSAKAKVTHCPHGHEYDENNTYADPKTGHRFCLSCRKARNKGNANVDRTHCPQGHPYDEANTYRAPGTNRRSCKTCGRRRAIENYERNNKRRRDARRTTTG